MEDGQNNNDSSEEVKVRVGDSDTEEIETSEDELEKLSAEAQADFDDDVENETSDASAEEPKILSVAVDNSYSERGHVYRNHGFYAFRYVIMLLSGMAFLSALIGILSITISKLVRGDDFYVSPWLGPLYANLTTTVVVLGIIHLIISLTVGKNWRADDGKKRKYPTVLSVIYCVNIGVAAATFLVLFLGMLFGSMLGLNNAKGTDILEQFLISLIAIIILGFALVYKLNLIKYMFKAIYVIIMGAIAAAGVILFLAFPAKEIRDAIHDDNVEDDLYSIENAIEDYYDENNKLPDDLKELEFKKEDDLFYDASIYEYTPLNSNRISYYKYSSEYQICAEFRIDTTDDEDYYGINYRSYGYGRHVKGRDCFSRSVYGGYGPVYDDVKSSSSYNSLDVKDTKEEKDSNSSAKSKDDDDWSWLNFDDKDEKQTDDETTL